MGVLQQLSTVAAPARLRAESGGFQKYVSDFWAGEPVPEQWVSMLSASGVNVTPELAMTLSAVYCAVSTISYDLATLPVQVLARHSNDEGRDVVRPFYGAGIESSGGIRSLAYMLAFQPNNFQTATEFFLSFIPQFLLREQAYAEIVNGPTGFLEQLIPRHPDRVRVERLPSGRLRYRLTEANGSPRYLTQDEMFTVRGLSLDTGLHGASRTAYGTNALGTALAADRAAAKFFKSGMTAATVATYKGPEMGDEEEAALHASISRYAAGTENSFGLLLVPDLVDIKNLGLEPDKAQMMLAREWGVLDVARLFRIDSAKLMVKGASQSGTANEQDEIKHVSNCLRPIAHTIEQAIQRDLILRKDTYTSEFLLEEKLRGDTAARAAYFKEALQGPWMWPSEIRARENMNPDPALDELAKVRYRPGTPKGQAAPADGSAPSATLATHLPLKAILAVHDNAVRCLRRERAAVEKLAKKHASDVDGWQAGLREFYQDHAGFVSQTMRVSIGSARGYAAQHGTLFEEQGLVAIAGADGEAWERTEADALCALALHGDGVAA